jgi:hypothetical protein
MLDKQMYRNLPEVKPADLARVMEAYERVAELVGSFPQMRPGMVALVVDGPEHVSQIEPVARALGHFGLPTVRRVASAQKTPAFALQLVQQLDATFARLLFVAIGGSHSALADVIDSATSTPVFRAGTMDPETLALACAKTFAVEDTVLFGRVLLVQANMRSEVLSADAQLSAPPPAPNGSVVA